MQLSAHAARAVSLFCCVFLAAVAGVSGFRTGVAESQVEEAAAASEGCFLTRVKAFSKTDYRFQLEVTRYPGVKLWLAVKFQTTKPRLTMYWDRAWSVNYAGSFSASSWQLSPLLELPGDDNEINFLDVVSISYSKTPGKGECLNIEHGDAKWTELCGGIYLKERILKKANATMTDLADPIEVISQEIGPATSRLAIAFADGVLGHGALGNVVGMRPDASSFVLNATDVRAASLSLPKTMFRVLKCHPEFTRCSDNTFVPKGHSCPSKHKAARHRITRAASTLPEERGTSMAVQINCPSWMRTTNVELLSTKGRSAVLYKYDSSDVLEAQGFARVLKLPRSLAMEQTLWDEARQVPILRSLGVNVPSCNYCEVTYHGTDRQEHKSKGLIKELLHGLDLADIIASTGNDDGQFNVACLPKRLHPVDVDAVEKVIGNRSVTQQMAHTISLATGIQGSGFSRRKKLGKEIHSALKCVYGRFAADLLHAPKGLFMDLSARNLMWATLRPQDDNTAYRLWVVDSMPILPGTREFHQMLEHGPAEAWKRVYAEPWNFGPGECRHKTWDAFRLPDDPKLIARKWLKYCKK